MILKQLKRLLLFLGLFVLVSFFIQIVSDKGSLTVVDAAALHPSGHFNGITSNWQKKDVRFPMRDPIDLLSGSGALINPTSGGRMRVYVRNLPEDCSLTTVQIWVRRPNHVPDTRIGGNVGIEEGRDVDGNAYSIWFPVPVDPLHIANASHSPIYYKAFVWCGSVYQTSNVAWDYDHDNNWPTSIIFVPNREVLVGTETYITWAFDGYLAGGGARLSKSFHAFVMGGFTFREKAFELKVASIDPNLEVWFEISGGQPDWDTCITLDPPNPILVLPENPVGVYLEVDPSCTDGEGFIRFRSRVLETGFEDATDFWPIMISNGSSSPSSTPVPPTPWPMPPTPDPTGSVGGEMVILSSDSTVNSSQQQTDTTNTLIIIFVVLFVCCVLVLYLRPRIFNR